MFRKKKKFEINPSKQFYKCLLFLFTEYIIYLGFQFISYDVIDQMWREWYVGIILFGIHLIVIISIYSFIGCNYWPAVYVLKVIEFFVLFFFFGWTAGYFGYEGFSLTFIMLINYLILMLSIYLLRNVSIVILLIMIILLLVNSIVQFGLSKEWWEPTIVLVFLTVQILTFNYDSKRLWEISQMWNPREYM